MGAHLTSSQFMRNSKYVIFGKSGLEMPVVFSPLITHSDVSISGADEVIAAGFCEKDEAGQYYVWGESLTLKKKSRPQDAEIINRYLAYEC